MAKTKKQARRHRRQTHRRRGGAGNNNVAASAAASNQVHLREERKMSDLFKRSFNELEARGSALDKEEQKMSDLFNRSFNELKARGSALNKEYEDRRVIVKQHLSKRPNKEDPYTGFWQEYLRPFIESHDVLYLINTGGKFGEAYSMAQKEMDKAHAVRDGEIKGFITPQHVYLFYYTGIAPVYSFDRPLTIKQLSLIDALFQRDKNSPFYLKGSIVHRMYGDPYRHSNPYFYEASRQFESVIRLIKGSYQNGSWRQLDGFFGLYYNDDTNQLIDYPPPTYSLED